MQVGSTQSEVPLMMASCFISSLALRDWGTCSRMNTRRFALGNDICITVLQ